MNPVNRLLFTVTAALIVLHLAGLMASAQAGYAGPTGERNRDEAERDLEDRIANRRLLAALHESRRANDRRDPRLALEQLQEDFTRLQLVNKELVLTTARQTEVDLKLVSRKTAEIHRRAQRLMENLALPAQVDGNVKPSLVAPENAIQLRESVTKLGWLIYRFAKNPIFKEVDVIEQQSALQARRNLEEIISLSELMKKSSERLARNSKK